MKIGAAVAQMTAGKWLMWAIGGLIALMLIARM
jgi:hypothetical protein